VGAPRVWPLPSSRRSLKEGSCTFKKTGSFAKSGLKGGATPEKKTKSLDEDYLRGSAGPNIHGSFPSDRSKQGNVQRAKKGGAAKRSKKKSER